MLSQRESGLVDANRFGLSPGHAGAGLQSTNQSAACDTRHVSDSGVDADSSVLDITSTSSGVHIYCS